MIQLEMIKKRWTLIPPPAADGSIEAREIEFPESVHGNPRFTVDAENQRHLLIPAPESSKLIVDKKSSGVQLHANLWGEPSHQKLYVDLVCLKPHLNDLFDLIVFDVLSGISASSEPPDRICHKVLNHWRELLSASPTTVPDNQALLGLIGELVVLRYLAQINPKALSAWIGPEHGRYDFFAGGYAIEVKTTTQRNSTILTIHGIDQLAQPISGNLSLFVFQVFETPGSGENIGSLISSLVELGIDWAAIYNKLIKLGVTPDIVNLLSEQRYSIQSRRVYVVDSQFPRITKASFKNDSVPLGVLSLSYQIDISVPPPNPLSTEEVENLLHTLAESIP